jgi:integrase
MDTGLRVPPVNWSQRSQAVKHGQGMVSAEAEEINLRLDILKRRAEEVFKTAFDQDQPLDIHVFKEVLFKSPMSGSLVTYTENYINESCSALKPSTIETYRAFLLHLSKMPIKSTRMANLSNFAHDLESYLIKEGLSANTRKKYHARAKTVILAALRMGANIINPYKNYKIGTIKGNRIYLEKEEVRKLVNLYESKTLPTHLQNTLEYFLFSCFTGLRHSDLAEVKSKDVVDNILTFYPIKNRRYNQRIEIPLPVIARKLIKGKRGKLFDVLSVQKSNQNLRAILTRAGIRKEATMHCGRHTFATMFLLVDGRIETLQQLLGHSKLETTMVYAKVVEQKRNREIIRMDNLFDE